VRAFATDWGLLSKPAPPEPPATATGTADGRRAQYSLHGVARPPPRRAVFTLETGEARSACPTQCIRFREERTALELLLRICNSFVPGPGAALRTRPGRPIKLGRQLFSLRTKPFQLDRSAGFIR